MEKRITTLLEMTTLLAALLAGVDVPIASATATGTILVSEEYTDSRYSFNSPYFEPFKSLLIAQGYTVTVSTSTVTPSLLSGVNVLIVHLPTTQYSSSEIDVIEAFVSSGGGLFCIADHSTYWRVDDIIARWGFSQASGYVTDSNNYVGGYDYWVYYEAARGNFATHPITSGLTRVQSACSNWFLSELPSGAVSIITTDTDGTASPSGVSIYSALDTGTGRIAITMDGNYFECSGDPNIGLDIDDNADLGLNTIAWLFKYEHDVAVYPEAPAFLEPGNSALLNATIYNGFGLSNETNVELQLLINGTVVDSVLIPELLTGSWYTLSYFWTPTVKGIYNVTAYAPPVLGETFITNNVRSKIVQVCKRDVAVVNVMPSKTVVGRGYSLPMNVTVENQGDITEPNLTPKQWQTFWSMGDVNRDGYIDDLDRAILEAAYGSVPGDPNWDPRCDLNMDGIIDWGDIKIMILNYGKDIWTYFGLGINVTVYANATSIASQTITLTSGNSTTITFTWNTTGFAKGNYTIWAYAEPVPGETDTADNTLTDDWVIIAIVGDVNADGIVDIEDIYLISLAYGSRPINGEYWHPTPCGACPHSSNTDINSDRIVDIEDIYTAALHYGEIDP